MSDESGTIRINATVKIDTRDAINKIASAEVRTFSSLVSILLQEAIEARKQAKNKKA